jgi:UDP-glucuronate decarboxylase
LNGFLRVIARGVPGETYNIGNPVPEISMQDLVAQVSDVLGRPVPCNVIEYPDSYPADEPNRRCPDIRKAQLQLKYHPTVDLRTGLRRFLGWSDRMYTGQL